MASGVVDFMFSAVLIGVGATLVMDAWALFQTKVLRWQTLDYALVGRWLGHMPGGRIAHESIRAASPIPGEAAIGWIAHYATGVVFAAILLSIFGLDWADQPTPAPALAVGLSTIVVPFFLMQPSFGMGIAASRTPNPGFARVRAVLTHLVFGVGMYVAALLLAALI